jgi:rhodanese-related sulfurtransferase
MVHSPGFLALVNDAKSRVKQTDLDGYRSLLASGSPHLLVDCREESEWTAGHAAGALYLGKGVIERDIEVKAPDKDATLVIYCGGGFRSALVCDNLQRMGYRNCISLDGGWRAWTAAGMPVEK